MPMDEFLELRMEGVKVEEATSWLERISGKIEIENLNPSWLVFNEAFVAAPPLSMVRRVLSVIIRCSVSFSPCLCSP